MSTTTNTGRVSSHPDKKAAELLALELFHGAAERVPAYRTFLARAGVKPGLVRSLDDFTKIPSLDKPNYISQFNLKDLCWDGRLDEAKYISTSSGSTGAPFFWPRGKTQDEILGATYGQIYEKIFDTRQGHTLMINSFALGTWIAGLELYNATKWTSDNGNAITIMTPGIEKREAVRQLKEISPLFTRTILAGYPPFIKDIVESGLEEGIKWETLDVRLMVAGESISEAWRDRLLELIDRPGDIARVINVYGMAESGVVAHETPTSILLRRALNEQDKNQPDGPDLARLTGIYQYYPGARYFQAGPSDALYLTSPAGLPLIRYNTRDEGGLIDYETAVKMGGDRLIELAEQHHVDLSEWRMPFIYLYGRKDLSIHFYALNIYVENIKAALEHRSIAANLSGMFTMSTIHTANLNQQLQITIELASGKPVSAALQQKITSSVTATLKSVNSEYDKLYSSMGSQAEPSIILVKHGDIETTPGKKHRWAKRA